MLHRVWKWKKAQKNANMLLAKHPFLSNLCALLALFHWLAAADVPELGPLVGRLDENGKMLRSHHRELVLILPFHPTPTILHRVNPHAKIMSPSPVNRHLGPSTSDLQLESRNPHPYP